MERPGTPKTPHEILNRLNEVSFNAVLIKELKMMAVLRKNAANLSNGEGAEWARMRVHIVRNPVMNKLRFSSKLDTRVELPEHAEGGRPQVRG